MHHPEQGDALAPQVDVLEGRCFGMYGHLNLIFWDINVLACPRLALAPTETHDTIKSDKEVAASGRVANNYFTEMCSGSEAGSFLRLIDFCIQ
jgi:hypothetical protein